jgi:DNA-binding IclR family transcriptional regulator
MHQPTLRVLQVLQSIAAEGQGKRLTELSRELDIPKSTLLPILQTLCQQQFLTQDDAGRYGAGTSLFSLGAAFNSKFPILPYVHQRLEGLVRELGETCYFGVLDEGQVLYLEKADSPQPLRMLTTVGHRLPAYATGLGKALLMESDLPQLSALYPTALMPLTEHTITDLSALHAQLKQARQDGYTWESEESTPHVRCFAVPVRKHGAIVAAISMTIPLFRYEESQKERILDALTETSRHIQLTIEKTNAHFTDIF